MMSPFVSELSWASLGLIHAAVSQVSFVIGFGASCSQPLFEKRPSQTLGSGRNTISSPGVAAGAGRGAGAAGGATATGAAAGAAAAAGVGVATAAPAAAGAAAAGAVASALNGVA